MIEKNFGVRVRKNDTVKVLKGAHKGKLAFVEHATMFTRIEHDVCSDGSFPVGQLLNVFVEDVGRIQLTDVDVALLRDLLIKRMEFWQSRRKIQEFKNNLKK